MSQPDLFFYCGMPSLVYLKQRSALPEPFVDFEFLRVLDFDGGLEAFRSGDTSLSAITRRCCAEMQEVFGIDLEGYIAQAARTHGMFLEEATEQTWFCCFEAYMLGYPFGVNIFHRKAFDYTCREWVLDRCHMGIFPVPPMFYVRVQTERAGDQA